MDLTDRVERVRLRLLQAYHRLNQEGVLSEAQLEEAIETIDRLEGLDAAEIGRRLGSLQPPPPSRTGDG